MLAACAQINGNWQRELRHGGLWGGYKGWSGARSLPQRAPRNGVLGCVARRALSRHQSQQAAR
jgi:hypothetical protein